MKKIGFLAFAAAGMLLASCSQEEVVAPAGDGNFSVTVKLPSEGVSTRALGTGLVADNLQMAVYDVSNGQAPRLITTQRANFGYSLETTVTFNLANGKSYKIAFFAQSGISETPANGKQAYLFDPQNMKIVADYSAMTSDGNLGDAYDCFYNLYETGTITSQTTGTTIYLYRPVAQINWGTNDYEAVSVADDNAFGTKGQYVQSTLKTNAYTEFDMIANDVVATSLTTVELEWSDFAAPTAETFPVEGYEYVAMQYVFAPKQDPAVYDLNLNISNGLNPNADVITNDDVYVSNAPVQANYRTNIYGSLLTNPNVFTVVKSPDWTNDYNIEMQWDGKTVTPPTIDNGKAIISNPSEIAGIADAVSNGEDYDGVEFTLANDIDMGGHSISFGKAARNSGDPADDSTPFRGTFDGKNFTISNISITGTANKNDVAAFIPNLDGTGVVKDVVFENFVINAPQNEQAGVVGLVSGGATVSNVTVKSGSIKSAEGGGLVARILKNGTVEDCVNYASVTVSVQNAGGIVGAATYTENGSLMKITGCTNHGEISGPKSVGGIVGTSAALVEDCENNGVVNGTSNTGGIAGYSITLGGVKGCTNNAAVYGSSEIGGIVGFVSYLSGDAYPYTEVVEVSGNVNNGDVASIGAGGSVGGIVGRWNSSGTCTDNENYAASLKAGATNGAAAGIVGGFWGSSQPTVGNGTLTLTGNQSSTPLDAMTGKTTALFFINNGGTVNDSDNTVAQ